MSRQIHNGYYHVTPGRLRVRVTGIKQDREAAKSLEILLLSQPGVDHVSANPITSNVLVKFDADTILHEDILQSLADLGHLPVLSEREQRRQADGELSEIGLYLGKNIAKAALKQALRSFPAAIILELL